MRNFAYPYRRCDADAVRADAWFIEAGGERRQLQAYVPEWDYNTDLQLSCEIAANPDEIRAQTHLQDGVKLALTVSWSSNTTYLRELAFQRELDEPFAETIAMRLPGRLLAGTLTLITRVVLSTGPVPNEAFTAYLPGSVLWEKQDQTRLQGDAPLFPISVVDFERAGFPRDAPWKLQIDGEVNSALLGSIRLYVNASNPIVVDAFKTAAPTPENERVLSAAYADVARVFVEYALAEHESIPADPDPDSLGAAYADLLARLFPGEAAESIRDRRSRHPGDFGADLLAKVKLFGG